jgi:hypothetical protein
MMETVCGSGVSVIVLAVAATAPVGGTSSRRTTVSPTAKVEMLDEAPQLTASDSEYDPFRRIANVALPVIPWAHVF